MKLQLLVPQYKEDDSILKSLLDSLVNQENVDYKDFGVIIVNDGSEIFLTDEFLKSYPFKIEYYKEKHRGVSGTRNACLDHAKAEYIMFCDADDKFFSDLGLFAIFQEIKNDGFDVLVSVFVEETMNPITLERTYINREQDRTFVHGKVFRRRYLYEQNIRWNENLTIHEDSYFNILTQTLSKNVKYMQTPFYLWKWRDESVCRRDYTYILETYTNLIDSNTALVREFINRKMENEAIQYATSMLYDTYYNLNKDEWARPENEKYLAKTEKRFAEYFKEFRDRIVKIDQASEMTIISGIKNRMFNEGLRMERFTFQEFIDKISGLINSADEEKNEEKKEESL